MAESKWEDCVIRDIIHPDPSLYAQGRAPRRFLEGANGPCPEAKSIFEYKIITEDQESGTISTKGPHIHEFREMFVFLGTDINNPDDLGADVEYWLGDGDDTEVIKTSTPTIIYIPSNVLHLPLFFKNVRRTVIMVVVGLDVGVPKVQRGFPLRGV